QVLSQCDVVGQEAGDSIDALHGNIARAAINGPDESRWNQRVRSAETELDAGLDGVGAFGPAQRFRPRRQRATASVLRTVDDGACNATQHMRGEQRRTVDDRKSVVLGQEVKRLLAPRWMEEPCGVLNGGLSVAVAELIQNGRSKRGRQLHRDDVRLLVRLAAPSVRPRRQSVIVAVAVFLIEAAAERVVLIEVMIDLNVVLLAFENVGAGAGAAVAADSSPHTEMCA